jgi:hypothetical protein
LANVTESPHKQGWLKVRLTELPEHHKPAKLDLLRTQVRISNLNDAEAKACDAAL